MHEYVRTVVPYRRTGGFIAHVNVEGVPARSGVGIGIAEQLQIAGCVGIVCIEPVGPLAWNVNGTEWVATTHDHDFINNFFFQQFEISRANEMEERKESKGPAAKENARSMRNIRQKIHYFEIPISQNSMCAGFD